MFYALFQFYRSLFLSYTEGTFSQFIYDFLNGNGTNINLFGLSVSPVSYFSLILALITFIFIIVLCCLFVFKIIKLIGGLIR